MESPGSQFPITYADKVAEFNCDQAWEEVRSVPVVEDGPLIPGFITFTTETRLVYWAGDQGVFIDPALEGREELGIPRSPFCLYLDK